jgi:hypothetical protein
MSGQVDRLGTIEHRRGDLLPVAGGGYVRVVNPDWPSGDEPFCERADDDEVPPQPEGAVEALREIREHTDIVGDDPWTGEAEYGDLERALVAIRALTTTGGQCETEEPA